MYLRLTSISKVVLHSNQYTHTHICIYYGHSSVIFVGSPLTGDTPSAFAQIPINTSFLMITCDQSESFAFTVSKLLAPETIAFVKFAPVKFVFIKLHCPKFAFSKLAPVKSASSKFAPNSEMPDKFAPRKLARFNDPFVKYVCVKSWSW